MQSRLRKLVEGVLFGEGSGPWPPSLEYEGKRYYRFHDFIYLSKPLEALDEKQVLAVCSIRNSHSTDQQMLPNSVVRNVLRSASNAYKPKLLLEIGPGLRPLFTPGEHDFAYELAELDPRIVGSLVSDGYSASLFNGQTQLKQLTGSVDLIVAVFVFQFPIQESQVEELVRVLSPEGLILANVFRRSQSSRETLQRSFARKGCKTAVSIPSDEIAYDHEYWILGRNLSNSGYLRIVGALESAGVAARD